MTHQVAILKIIDGIYNYDDDYNSTVAAGITEWEEVDDEQFKLLTEASKSGAHNRYERKFLVIEKLKIDSVDVIVSVSSFLKYHEDQTARRAAEKAKREATAQARKEKKMMKEEETRKALFLKLKSEFPDIA